MMNNHNCITLANYVTVNEIKHHKLTNKKLIDKHNDVVEECNKKDRKHNKIREEELEKVDGKNENKHKRLRALVGDDAIEGALTEVHVCSTKKMITTIFIIKMMHSQTIMMIMIMKIMMMILVIAQVTQKSG